MIIPGVGNFSTASRNIEPFKSEILDVIKGGTPTLGICLGMHLFFTESAEGGGSGLSLYKGKIVKLPNSVRIPHMGWNTLHIVKENPILENIHEETFFYFAHSYYPKLLKKEIIVAETTYGLSFASLIAEKNVYGTQFHPEKSGEGGLAILKNFAKIALR
jgi:glutamine amidotransferase